jgi:hypothetical protein
MADYRYAVGTIARATITGSQTITGIVDASGTFPIAAVLLFTTFQTANGFEADARYSFGFSDANQQCSVQAFTENDNSSTKFSRSHYSNIYALVANSSAQTTLTDAASVTVVGTGTFTLNWLANDGTPWDFHYVAIGGADLSAKVITEFSPTSTGTQAVTGIGFAPTGVIALDALSVGDASWGISTIALCPLPTLGWSDGTNQGAAVGSTPGFPASTTARRLQRTNAAILRISETTPSTYTQAVTASVTSLDADGFTLDWTQVRNDTGAGGSLLPGFYALVIGGPEVTAGAKLQGDASITGLTTPGLALFATVGNTVSSAVATNQYWTFGAVDAADNLASIFLGNANAADPSVAIRDRSTATMPTSVTPNIVPGSSTVNAALVPNLTASTIALTWSPNDAVVREVLYLAFEGGAPNPPQPFPPSESFVIPMRKLRRSTTYTTERMWNFFTRFQLDFQAGGPRDAREPIEICLRYSDDQGATWSDELWQTVDSLGNYSAIAQWFSLGRGRDRVWEVSSTSEAMTVWLAAYIDVIPGTHG